MWHRACPSLQEREETTCVRAHFDHRALPLEGQLRCGDGSLRVLSPLALAQRRGPATGLDALPASEWLVRAPRTDL